MICLCDVNREIVRYLRRIDEQHTSGIVFIFKTNKKTQGLSKLSLLVQVLIMLLTGHKPPPLG